MSTEGAAAAFAVSKLSALLGGSLLGAAIIAAVDPPKSRKELFLQALCAGIGGVIFGPVAARAADHYFDFIDLAHGTWLDNVEVLMPLCFIIGALSWGAAGALAKLRQLIAEHAAQKVVDRVTAPTERDPYA